MNREDDLLFTMRDPRGFYTSYQICVLVKRAAAQGHSLESGSYLGEMTVGQLDALVHGRTDA